MDWKRRPKFTSRRITPGLTGGLGTFSRDAWSFCGYNNTGAQLGFSVLVPLRESVWDPQPAVGPGQGAEEPII